MQISIATKAFALKVVTNLSDYIIKKTRLHEKSRQSVEKVKQKCLAFSLICGIINMVMKGAENRKTRKTSDRICMYGRADTGRPSAQKNR